jgi:hypothetical protein
MSKAAGTYTFFLLGAAMIAAKIAGLIDLPWPIVLMPIWMPVAALAFVYIIIRLLEKVGEVTKRML